MFDIAQCLKRIGHSGPTEPTRDTLTALQTAFLLRVPFENLDIHLGRPISLSPQNIYRKIVSRKRSDFSDMCHFQQTSPDSAFTRQRIVTMATPEGRVWLETYGDVGRHNI
jgi:N-hydroxyarylamine O-acetyltransferase